MEICERGMPASIPTIIDVIKSETNALSLNLSTISNNIETPTKTMNRIYNADMVVGYLLLVAGCWLLDFWELNYNMSCVYSLPSKPGSGLRGNLTGVLTPVER